MFEAERMMMKMGYSIKCRFRDNSIYFFNKEKDREIECDCCGLYASTMETFEPVPIEVEYEELECIINIISEIRLGVDIGKAIRNAMEGWRIYHMNEQSLVIYHDENLDYIQIENDGNCKSLRTLNALEKDKIRGIASFVFEFNDQMHYETVEKSYFSGQ